MGDSDSDDDFEEARRRFVTPTLVLEWGLYLGSKQHTHAATKLRLTHIVCVTTSARQPSESVSHCFVPLSDYGTTDLLAPGTTHLAQCCAAIEAARELAGGSGGGGGILVHCSQGVNRSPTIVIAYLMMQLGWPLRKAFLHVQAARPQISPHELYFAQLQALELRLSRQRLEVPPLAAPTLDREEIGPSLQEMLRGMYAESAEGAGGAAGVGTAAEASPPSATKDIEK